MRVGSSGVLLASNSMEMLKVRRLILHFFLLILRVLSNATPSSIHGSFWVTQTFSKVSFELNPRQKSHCLAAKLVLVLTKADSTTKEQSYKWGVVDTKNASSINMILVLPEGVLSGLQIWSNWFQPGGTNLCRTALFGAGVPYSKESPRASKLLFQNESVSRRFCESKSLVPLLRSLVLSNWASPNGLVDPLGLEKLEL